MRIRLRRSLAARLLLAQVLVIVAGSATLALVALAIAPGIFHDHIRNSDGIIPDDVARHIDEAFGAAVLIALAVAIGAAFLTALAVSTFISLRIVKPIRALAEAAERIAKGAYAARVPATGSDEIAVLGSAFNEMVTALESAERKRRELLSDVAHELRTPLATLDAYLEGLADGVVEPNLDTWKLLRNETGRLGRLTEDVTKVSRAEERQLELRVQRVAAIALLETSAGAAAPAFAAKGVEIEISPERDSPSVEVDPDRLGEVLANLLENALRHTPAGGTVTLSAKRAGDDAVLAVTDTGEGLSPDDLDRVFERFYRVDRARSRDQGGSGIGLAIARALVEAHGGQLWADSVGVGRGATFFCRLPAAR